MTWFYLSLLSAIGFSGMNIFSRVVSLDSKHPRTLAVALNLIAIFLVTAIWLLTSDFRTFSLPREPAAYLFMLMAVFLYGYYERLRFRVAKAVEASLLGIINTSSVVIAFVIALFLYSETVSAEKITGFCLVLTSLILISWGRFKNVSLKGFALALFSNLLIGVAWALDKKGVTYFNSTTYNLIVWLLPFFVLIYPGVNMSRLKKEYSSSFGKLLLIAVFNVAAFYLNLIALSMADATKVMPIVQTATIFSVLAGIVFLGEKEHLGKKLLAALNAFVGVYFLR